jgi:hypothetical protein
LLLSFAFYDLLLLFNVLVLKAIIVENNIMSASTFYGQITEGSRKGAKHVILETEDAEHFFLEPAFCKSITKDPICEDAKPLLVCMCPNERKSNLKFMLRKRNGGTGWVNFFTFWDFFRAIGLKNRENYHFSNFELVGTEEDPKILKSRRTEVVTNDMKQIFGGGHIRFLLKRTFQP